MSCSCCSKKSQINAMGYSSDDNHEYYLRTVDHPKIGPNNAYYVNAYFDSFPKDEEHKTKKKKKKAQKRSKKHEKDNLEVFQEPQEEEINHDDPQTNAVLDHDDKGENRTQENVPVINVAIAAAVAPFMRNNDEAQPVGDRGVLVFRKQLQVTDTSDHHNRLLIPKKQILHEFLTVDEEWTLKHQPRAVVPAKLVFDNNEYDIKFRMQKLGKTSYCYTIGKPWNDIREDNGLKTGMKVELRALRREGQQLWITLARSQEW